MLRGSKIPYFKTRKPDPNPTKITRTRQEPEGINPNPTRTREAIPEPDPNLTFATRTHHYSKYNRRENRKAIKITILYKEMLMICSLFFMSWKMKLSINIGKKDHTYVLLHYRYSTYLYLTKGWQIETYRSTAKATVL